MEQWQVERSTGRCSGTDGILEPGQEYYAALIDKQDHFERCDYCCDYWDQAHPQVFSFWKTRVPLPAEKKKLLVDDAVLMNFFERLADESDQLKVNFRFVLALILMRKRRLKYEESHRQGDQEIWRMRVAGQKEIHEVINPRLDDEQIQQVSQELSAILQGDF